MSQQNLCEPHLYISNTGLQGPGVDQWVAMVVLLLEVSMVRSYPPFKPETITSETPEEVLDQYMTYRAGEVESHRRRTYLIGAY
jgi:hypothetical protein